MKKQVFAAMAVAAVMFFTNTAVASVGLHASGGIQEIINNGFSSQQFYWAGNHPEYAYYNEVLNAPYAPLTGHSGANWNNTGVYGTDEAMATSDARADFGSLGVKSYSWVHPPDYDLLQPHPISTSPNKIYIYEALSSANAAFFDEWKINDPLLNGVTGSLAVTVDLDGAREGGNTSLNLTLYNFSRGQAEIQQAYDNEYVLTIPFTFGATNNVEMSLTAYTHARWEGRNLEYNDPTYNNHQTWDYVGTSSVDFLHTATITGMSFFDQNGNKIYGFDLETGSGHDYSAVPEPASMLLIGSGLAGLLGLKRQPKLHSRTAARR